MNPKHFEQQFARERRLLSAGFATLALVLIAAYVVQHPGDLFNIAAEAYEQPVKVVSDVIRGIAVR